MSETRTLKVVIVGNAKSAENAVRKLGGETEHLGRRANDAGGAWTGFGGSILAAGGMAVAGLGVAAGAVGMLGIKTAANFENMEVSFGTLLKSSAKAKEEMQWLKEKAAATPFELSDLTKADQVLLGFGFKSTQVRRDFVMNMGEMAAAVGLPSSALPDLGKIFGQVHAAGVVGMEDINQLIDNGVPIWDMLTAATGKSVKELRKEIEARKLSASTFEKATQTYTKNNFAGAMDKQSQTLSGLWSTLKDNVSLAAMDMVKPLVPMIKQWLPKLSELAAKAGVTMTTKVIPAASKFAKHLGEVASFVKRNWDLIEPFVAQLAALGVIIGVVTVAMRIWAAVQAVLNVLQAANPIGLIIIAIIALIAVIAYLWKNNETFRKVVIAVWNAIKGAVMAVVNWFKTYIPPVFAAVVAAVKFYFNLWKTIILTVFNAVKAYLMFFFNLYKAIFTKGWAAIKAVTSAVWNAIKAVLSGVFNFIKGVISRSINGWKAIISGAWNAIKSLTSSAWNAWVNIIRSVIGKAMALVTGIKSKVMGALSGAYGWLKSSGAKIIDGLADGIRAGMGKVKDAVKDVLAGARRLLPFSPAKEGPFSGKGWTLYSGRSIPEALAKGIASRRGLVVKATRGMVKGAHPGGLYSRSLAAANSQHGANVVVHVGGHVTAERDLAKAIAMTVRDEISRNGKRNGGFTGL
ncbi:tape measure protein [Micromonospora coerulea]|uniref:tape measure protein n=1 Tax=Micromonospora coerulea TaxID=47856 RepID=UPI0019061065|nr:tape measure protein [Micromonospora veneta]